MEENQTLRSLVKGLGAFVAEGSGGTLAKLGWNHADFERFVNKSSTDTAYESHQRIKSVIGKGGSTSSAAKRRADGGADDAASKRARSGTESGDVDGGFVGGATGGYPLPLPNTYQRSPAPPAPDSNLFSQLVRNAGTHMYMPPSQSTQAGGYPNYTPQTFLPSLNANANTLPPLAYGDSSPQLGRVNNSAARTPVEDDDDLDLDPKKEEASKLLG
jgi:hypothetical protein